MRKDADTPKPPLGNQPIPPPYVRKGAAARVERWLSQAAQGSGTVATILGGAEMGVAAILQFAATHARSRGFAVLRVPGITHEVPGLMTSRLLRELGVEPEMHYSDVASLARLRSAIRDIESSANPVLLVIEQVERCSDQSLALIEDLASALPCRHLILVISVDNMPGRPRNSNMLAHFLDQLSLISCHEQLELGPLLSEEVAVMMRQRNETSVAPRRFANDLVTFSGASARHAEFVIQYVASLPISVRGQLLSGSLAIDDMPASTETLERISWDSRALDGRSLSVLEAMGVWALPCTAEDVATLTLMPIDTVEVAIDMLNEHGFVLASQRQTPVAASLARPIEGWALGHILRPFRRQELMERARCLAQTHAASGLGDVRIAKHLVRTESALSIREIEYVAAAAHNLIEQSRYNSAQLLLFQLLQCLQTAAPEAHLPSPIAVMLAETAARSGEWREAERFLATELDCLGTDNSILAGRRQARDLTSAGRDTEALDVYAEFLASPLSVHDRAKMELDAAAAYLGRGQTVQAIGTYEHAAYLAINVDALDIASEAHVRIGAVWASMGQARQALATLHRGFREAIWSRDNRVLARCFGGVGLAFAQLGPLRRGERWLKRAIQEAERCGDAAMLSWASQTLSDICVELGDHEEAYDLIRLCIEIDTDLHRPRSLAAAKTRLRLLRALQGSNTSEDGLTGQLSALHPSDALMVDYVRALEFGSEADLKAARSEFELLRGSIRGEGTRYRYLTNLLPQWARNFALLQDATGLRSVVNEFESLAQGLEDEIPVLLPTRSLMEAHLAALADEWTAAAEHAGAASAGFQRLDWRLREAASRLLWGESLSHTGRIEAAVLELREAHDLYSQMGIRTSSDRARQMLRSLGCRPTTHRTRRLALTARQAEIARLAAESLTDAEIADRLIISKRTASTHIHRILKRLGFTSRGQLAGWLRDGGLDART